MKHPYELLEEISKLPKDQKYDTLHMMAHEVVQLLLESEQKIGELTATLELQWNKCEHDFELNQVVNHATVEILKCARCGEYSAGWKEDGLCGELYHKCTDMAIQIEQLKDRVDRLEKLNVIDKGYSDYLEYQNDVINAQRI